MNIAAMAGGWSAGFAGGFNLFRRPHVRLGELHVFSCAGNLALMSFC
jgi:hypothetical protein